MYASDVDELELGSPAEIAVLSALNERLDAIDVSGCDAIFDMLDVNGNGRLSFEELRLGVASDAVTDYIRETGNVVMKGYLKDAAATADAFRLGAFASGDLAVKHADGYVQIKDRSKDIIISGGENISTVEIEAALMEHDDVEECAVVARPDAHWGETPCAFVETRAGATLDEAALLAFAKGRLAGFKAPKSVVFGALPKTSTGKIQKFALRDRARAL